MSNIFKTGKVSVEGESVTIFRPKLRAEMLEEEKERRRVLEELLMREAEEIREAQERLQDLQAEADQVLERARKKADQIRADAETQAAEQLAAGRAEADKIIAEAQQQAETIVKEAESKKEDVFKAEREKGYNEGHREAFEQVSSEAAALILKAEQVLQEVQNLRQRIIEGSRDRLLSVVRAMAKRILHRDIKSVPDDLLPRIEYAISRLVDRETITVRLNPDDVPVFRQYSEIFYRKFDDLKSIMIEEDSSLNPGDVVIDSNMGSVDSRLDTEIEEIIEGLRHIPVEIDENEAREQDSVLKPDLSEPGVSSETDLFVSEGSPLQDDLEGEKAPGTSGAEREIKGENSPEVAEEPGLSRDGDAGTTQVVTQDVPEDTEHDGGEVYVEDSNDEEEDGRHDQFCD